MLKRTLQCNVPHVTECHAIFHNAFRPQVKLPMDLPRPALGGSQSAKEAAKAALHQSEKKKHTLVLDIDETLIHTVGGLSGDVPVMKLGRDKQPKGFEDVAQLYDLCESKNDMGQFISHATYFKFLTRPYLQEFLEEVTELFEVVFWTAGTAPYMAGIINGLERQVLQNMLAGRGSSYNNTLNTTLAPSSTIVDNTSFLFDFRKNMCALGGPNGTSYSSVVNSVSHNTPEAIDKQGPLMNYYGYSRAQTLGQNYLKHIPLLGKRAHIIASIENGAGPIGLPPNNFGNGAMSYIDPSAASADNVIMMDDAVRSFVFTPRSAILVDQFKFKGRTNEVCNDTFLRDVMPMLRAVAKAECATVELDHWRNDDYTKYDDMDMSMGRNALACPSSSLAKTETHIGSFLSERRLCSTPIAAFKPFGKQYESSMKASVDAEVLHLQGQSVATESGFMHLFREQ